MVIDLKYHLTTIIAIFLALGIGILIGSAMIGDDGMVREQQLLIVQIEKDLNSLRTQNSQYRAQQLAFEGMIVEQNELIEQLFQDAITGRLTGMRCLLVPDPKSQGNRYLTPILKVAGMDVTDFTSLPEQWQPTNPADGWDLCLLMTQSLPPGVEKVFSKDRIYRPTVKDLSSKKIQYQLVKALTTVKEKLLPLIEANVEAQEDGGVKEDDFRVNSSVQ